MSSREKLDDRTRYFWKNLFYYFLIVSGAVLLFAGGMDSEGPFRGFDIGAGISIVGFFSIIILGFKIVMDLTNDAYSKDRDRGRKL